MKDHDLIEEALTASAIGAFFEVYNILGFGFLESNYARALDEELTLRGHVVDRELPVPVYYKGKAVGTQRLDLVVDRKLIIEVKSTYQLHQSAIRQIYSYLRGTRLDVELILHFGPKPKFYRQIWKTDRTDLMDKSQQKDVASNPFDPFDPFS